MWWYVLEWSQPRNFYFLRIKSFREPFCTAYRIYECLLRTRLLSWFPKVVRDVVKWRLRILRRFSPLIMLRGDQTFARGRSSSQQSPFIANTLTSMKVYSILTITIQKCTRHMFVSFSLLNDGLNKKNISYNWILCVREDKDKLHMLSLHPIIRMSFPDPLVPECLVSRSLRVIQHGQSKEHPGFPGWYIVLSW